MTNKALRVNAGVTLDQARDARARAWAFVFRCHESKNTPAEPSGREDKQLARKERRPT